MSVVPTILGAWMVVSVAGAAAFARSARRGRVLDAARAAHLDPDGGLHSHHHAA